MVDTPVILLGNILEQGHKLKVQGFCVISRLLKRLDSNNIDSNNIDNECSLPLDGKLCCKVMSTRNERLV